jgi:hypothetical protein
MHLIDRLFVTALAGLVTSPVLADPPQYIPEFIAADAGHARLGRVECSGADAASAPGGFHQQPRQRHQ